MSYLPPSLTSQIPSADPPDLTAVARYLSGESDAAERDGINRWARSAESNARWLAELGRLWSADEAVCATWDLDALWQRVMVSEEGVLSSADGFGAREARGEASREGAGERRMGNVGKQTLRRGVRSVQGTVLASLGVATLAFLTLTAGWQALFHVSKPQFAVVETFSTTAGHPTTITLADGSVVSLNVASQLDVPVDYSRGNRTLHLRGEALFTVSRRTTTPFVVIAGNTTVRVLGTTFAVRHYNADTTAVAVREGRVSVQSPGNSLVLAAGRYVEMGRAGVTQVRSTDDGEFSFATGVLTLNRVSIAAAIPALDRWYGVDIRLGSPALATQEMAGRLPTGSPAELIEMLETTYDVRVVRDGMTLTLFPR